MTNRNTILSTLKRVKPSLEKKYSIRNMAIFGSYSRNTAITGDSDLDVLVEFSQPIGLAFVDLADELELLLNMKVDLVSRNGIKSKYFASIEPDLIYV